MWNFLRGWWNVAIPVAITVRPTFDELEDGGGGGAGARDFFPVIRGSVEDLVGDGGLSQTPQRGPDSTSLWRDLAVRRILTKLVDQLDW